MDGWRMILRRPYTSYEPGMIRCHGYVELFWSKWTRFQIAATLIIASRHSDRRLKGQLHLGFWFVQLFVFFPWWARTSEERQHWGINLSEGTTHLYWGERCKIFWNPFGGDWQRSYVWTTDQKWLLVDIKGQRNWEVRRALEQQAQTWDFPYAYTLKSGEVQERTATIKLTRAVWRTRIIRWLPFFEDVQEHIDVEFSDEVGERAGSWKGGCTGCSHRVLADEGPEQCLRRMERERKFG